ncbi:PIG-L family deacetylase [Streptomyces pathocidini]|uniref:PIG-L family deacetylase n=1 Tax=Streptomyces pathocidini TaxID=1650571 RepID=UPI0033E5EB78
MDLVQEPYGRRGVLGTMAALGAVTAVGCGAGPVKAPEPATSSRTQARPAVGAARDPLVMQILAHPDDDLFFMNPELARTFDSGVPVVSVYLTSGASNGVNQAPGAPSARPDRAAYSAARHQGLRQAYATMLGAEPFTAWEGEVLSLPNAAQLARGSRVRAQAELNTLTHRGRRAALVFLNIRMRPEGRGDTGMPQLWGESGTVLHTLPAAGSPVREVHAYDRQGLIDSLVFLFDTYRPTLIRTLDPDPDIQVHDTAHPRGSDQPGFSDHRDHTAAALFAWRAMAQWAENAARRGRAPRFLAEAYRGYYVQRWPHNLPEETVRLKASYLDAYGGGPAWSCGNRAGCGDYAVGQGRVLRQSKGWVRSTVSRYPTAGPRVLAGAGRRGVREVYGVLGTRAARWRETAPGSGAWGEPEDLGGGPLAPALCAIADREGRHLVFALRFSGLEGAEARNTREIVLLEQGAPGGRFKPWRGLGNPERGASHGRRSGAPLALATPDGRIHLFVRDSSEGLSTRVRDPGGRWSGWHRLAGGQVQEGLAGALDSLGRVHVFAAGRDSVHHWAQRSPGGPVQPRPPGPVPPPGDAPAAARSHDGSLHLVYRLPLGAGLATHRLGPGADGDWSALRHREAPGYGAVALSEDGEAGAYGPLVGVRGGSDGPAQLLAGERLVGTTAGSGVRKAAKSPTRGRAVGVTVGRPAVLGSGERDAALLAFGPAAELRTL